MHHCPRSTWRNAIGKVCHDIKRTAALSCRHSLRRPRSGAINTSKSKQGSCRVLIESHRFKPLEGRKCNDLDPRAVSLRRVHDRFDCSSVAQGDSLSQTPAAATRPENAPEHNRAQEVVGPVNHLQPDGRNCLLVKEGRLRHRPERLQGLSEQLSAEVRILAGAPGPLEEGEGKAEGGTRADAGQRLHRLLARHLGPVERVVARVLKTGLVATCSLYNRRHRKQRPKEDPKQLSGD